MINKRRLTPSYPKSFLDLAICMVLARVNYRKGGKGDKCPCERCDNSVQTKDSLHCLALGALVGAVDKSSGRGTLVVRKGMTCDEAIPSKKNERK